MGVGKDQLDAVSSIVPSMSGSTRSLNAEIKAKSVSPSALRAKPRNRQSTKYHKAIPCAEGVLAVYPGMRRVE
jgi:hypothetical protein